MNKFARNTLATAALLAAGAASAATISGLVNTGAGFTAGQQDTNYALSVVAGSTSGLGSYGYVAPNSGFPIGPWLANTATSKWLTPTRNAGQSFDPSVNGVYDWTLSFDLTGFDASTASFTAHWAADNYGIVKLNGNTVAGGATGGFSAWSPNFTVSSGFVAGVNTLTFEVTNIHLGSGNPTGVRVEFLDSSVAAVPEPESYALMLAGLGAVGFIARRRQAAR